MTISIYVQALMALYLCTGSFLAGRIIADGDNLAIWKALYAIPFIIVCFPLIFAWHWGEQLFSWLHDVIQLKSYWMIYTGQLDSLSEEKLKALKNRLARLNDLDKKTYYHRHEIYLLGLILKRQKTQSITTPLKD